MTARTDVYSETKKSKYSGVESTLGYSPSPFARSPYPGSPAKTPTRRSPRRVVYSPTSSEKTRAHLKLADFYRKSVYKTKKTKTRLAAACRDSNICLILGSAVDADLRKFFAGFVKFRFLAAATRLGKPSANGFIHQLRFSHHDYEAYAILKSVVQPKSDNAVYEFRVGTYLNNFVKRFPCFVETYGLFKYNGPAQWRLQMGEADVHPDDMKRRIERVPYSLRAACATPELFAVLIQSIPNPTFIYDLPDDANLFPILYQIYFPLGHLQNTFTHYDLHINNVLLYEPAPNKYIEYHYHAPEGVVRFKSNYLAKIIDYGRSYFYDGRESSATIYRDLFLDNCDIRARGFRWLNPKNGSSPFFTTARPNPKFDLRFFQFVKDYLNPTKKIHQKFDLTQFAMSRALIPPDFPLADYGGAECTPGDICDCAGARDWLGRVLSTLPDRFEGQEKFGDLHVHPDSPFIFTLA